MPEHRKKERRKKGSDGELKYTKVVPSCSDDDCTTFENKEGSSSPVVNSFVIDSDDDCTIVASGISEEELPSTPQNDLVQECPKVIKQTADTAKLWKNCRRVLPQKGTEERAEVLKTDAKRRTQNAAGKHLCPYCSYCAPFPSKVRRHITNIHNKSHECSKCNSRFDTHSKLRKHVSVEHPTIHFCEFCNYSSRVRAMVRKHTILQHENGVTCTVAGCNQRVSRWRLKSHLAEMHSTNAVELYEAGITSGCAAETRSPLIKCSRCGFDASDVEDYNLHVMRAHEIGIECPVPECSARFFLNEVDNHFALMHEKETFECSSQSSVCADDYGPSCTTSTVSDYVSTSNCSDTVCSDIEKNLPMECVKYRGAGQGFHCCICNRNYRDLYLLKKHIKRVHERSYAKYTRLQKYACAYSNCGRTFTTSGLLQDHINKHLGVKPYECTSCCCSFYAKARFAVHLSKYHKTSIRDYTNTAALLKRDCTSADNEFCINEADSRRNHS